VSWLSENKQESLSIGLVIATDRARLVFIASSTIAIRINQRYISNSILKN